MLKERKKIFGMKCYEEKKQKIILLAIIEEYLVRERTKFLSWITQVAMIKHIGGLLMFSFRWSYNTSCNKIIYKILELYLNSG